jgi:hypothetical protein
LSPLIRVSLNQYFLPDGKKMFLSAWKNHPKIDD